MVRYIFKKLIACLIISIYPLSGISSPTVSPDELKKINFTSIYSNVFIGELGATIFGIRDESRGVNYMIDYGDLSSTREYKSLAMQQAAGSGSFAAGAAAAAFAHLLIAEDASLIKNHLGEVRDKIKGLDLREMIEDEVRSIFSKEIFNKKPLNIKKLAFIKDRGVWLYKELAKPGEGATLLLDSAVYLSKGFRSLSVATIITLTPEPDPPSDVHFGDEEEGEGEVYPIYQVKIIYRSKAVNENINPVEYWKEEDKLQSSIKQGIEELGKMIRIAISNLGKEVSIGEKLSWEIGGDYPTTGNLIRNENGRDLVYKEGGIFSGSSYISFSEKDRYEEPLGEYGFED